MTRLISAACMLLLTATAPLAQVVDAAKPTSVADALQQLGYRATLEADSVGDPMIRTTVGGLNTTVFFYGCRDGIDCKEVQFSVGLDMDSPVSLETLNAWNEDKIAGTASLDAEGNVRFRFLVITQGGIPLQTFERAMFRWDQVVDEFKIHIGW
jgi:hypothetical protein